MLDLALYNRIDLRTLPRGQRLMARWFLGPDYRKIELVVEDIENLPAEPVILAMNHTDDFSYWPFQYYLHKRSEQYTATWVKGKNFEGAALSLFMRSMNNIPIASRGYLLTRDFLSTVGRHPTDAEYRVLRDALNAGVKLEADVPEPLLNRPRSILGRSFEPSREHYVEAMDALFDTMMGHFVRLNEQAVRMGLHILVFPQGSRSIRLSRGHGGIGQMALHLGLPIVPVGVSGGDVIYPTRSPFTRPGRVVYRIGEPIQPSELSDLKPAEPYAPFTRAASVHADAFQAVAERVMNRINPLLDERYRFAADQSTDGVTGTARFV